MTADRFTIRSMSLSDLELALDWAATEGWNPGINDANAFFAADPGGFLMGEIDGELISSISAVRYDDTFGFVGLYIVKPDRRGQGFGLRTWNAGLQLLGDRNVALDGVVAQVENYRKFGFQAAYRHIRYEGVGIAIAPPDNVVSLKNIPFTDILQYDRQHFPASRPAFLEQWINPPARAGYAYIKNGNLSGYGVIRECRTGFKIGPLFADDAQIAETLFQCLSSFSFGKPIFLDTPDANPQAIALAESYGMKPVFECVRMYNRGTPNIDIAHIFGVTTLELG
ncbi:GNAT family N-acetyltransferase [Planktothrix sp. FACHB-1355]|uniref:GNAT family N-acetyltransferase n=1 Tax=Aerosakkonema funiforme FACHB-1375 TaxID=2949571 RepID=A0A926VEC9_9CYAN|nr:MULTISPECIES: GNAT family N-acetyltransferase [Oscillatoriales]MBD2182356.1 GNAT family N-acetyltransferase [Aerosakkonema funiforme FACHB-1375]MBD3562227.1 GNAT family N-acetyltransferase [Planktothrix sp. FACHB-1355]